MSIRVKTENTLRIRSSSINTSKLSKLDDVDTSNLTDESKLAYSTTSGKWEIDNEELIDYGLISDT